MLFEHLHPVLNEIKRNIKGFWIHHVQNIYPSQNTIPYTFPSCVYSRHIHWFINYHKKKKKDLGCQRLRYSAHRIKKVSHNKWFLVKIPTHIHLEGLPSIRKCEDMPHSLKKEMVRARSKQMTS